jgi:hypothetical protein
MYIRLRVKYLLLLSDFNDACVFSTDFRKILKYRISWKSVQWEPSCSMWTGRHDEANSRFSQFCEKRLKMIPLLTCNKIFSGRQPRLPVHQLLRQRLLYHHKVSDIKTLMMVIESVSGMYTFLTTWHSSQPWKFRWPAKAPRLVSQSLIFNQS